jgi:hypothetical protein
MQKDCALDTETLLVGKGGKVVARAPWLEDAPVGCVVCVIGADAGSGLPVGSVVVVDLGRFPMKGDLVLARDALDDLYLGRIDDWGRLACGGFAIGPWDVLGTATSYSRKGIAERKDIPIYACIV